MKKLLLMALACLGLTANATVVPLPIDSSKEFYIKWVNTSGEEGEYYLTYATDTNDTSTTYRVTTNKTSKFKFQALTEEGQYYIIDATQSTDESTKYISLNGKRWGNIAGTSATNWGIIPADTKQFYIGNPTVYNNTFLLNSIYQRGLGVTNPKNSVASGSTNAIVWSNKSSDGDSGNAQGILQAWILVDVETDEEVAIAEVVEEPVEEPEAPAIAEFIGKKILLKNVATGDYVYSKVGQTKAGVVGTTANDVRSVFTGSLAEHASAAIFTLESPATGFKIQSVNSRLEFGGKANNSSTSLDCCIAQWSATYTATEIEGEENTFAFFAGTYAFHPDANNQVVFTQNPSLTDSQYWFTVEEISEFPVVLDGFGYATVCYPVAVNANSCSYTIVGLEGDMIDLEKISGVIPAKTPILVKGAPGATVKFTVADADATPATITSASFFKGTDITITNYAAGEIYTFVGEEFVKVTAATQVPAGSAYLLASAMEEGTADALWLEKESYEEYIGKQIHIKSVSNDNYMYCQATKTATGTLLTGDYDPRAVYTGSLADNAAASIFVISKSGEGVKIASHNSGLEFGGKATAHSRLDCCISQWSQVYTIIPVSHGVFALEVAGTYCLYPDDKGEIMLAANADLTDNKYWFTFEEISTFPVVLNSEGYATACFPVAVNKHDNAYYLTDIKDGKLTYEAHSGVIPANTPILVKGDSGETVEFTVNAGEPAAEAEVASWFQGTSLNVTGHGEGDVYTLNGNGFEKIAAGTTIPAGSAYILTSALPEGTEDVVPLDEKPTSSIGEINAVAEKQGVYDLQGRRLAQPVKGINIIGGHKVLVK